MANETDDILKALDDKEKPKKATNWELWSALYFAEFIFVLLDAGSALSVWLITGFWYYGLIVFFAGVIPLWLYTKQYLRPLASPEQRRTAFGGGVVAIGSVIVVAVFMAVLNFIAKSQTVNVVLWTEAGLAASLVALLAVHGFIMGKYFFSDEEIIENQRTNRIISRADRSVKRIGVANRVADAKRNEVSMRKQLEGKFSPAVVDRILNMLADNDGDGIPDIVDFVDNRTGKPFEKPQQLRPMTANSQEVLQVRERDTGTDPTNPPRKNG